MCVFSPKCILIQVFSFNFRDKFAFFTFYIITFCVFTGNYLGRIWHVSSHLWWNIQAASNKSTEYGAVFANIIIFIHHSMVAAKKQKTLVQIMLHYLM